MPLDAGWVLRAVAGGQFAFKFLCAYVVAASCSRTLSIVFGFVAWSLVTGTDAYATSPLPFFLNIQRIPPRQRLPYPPATHIRASPPRAADIEKATTHHTRTRPDRLARALAIPNIPSSSSVFNSLASQIRVLPGGYTVADVCGCFLQFFRPEARKLRRPP